MTHRRKTRDPDRPSSAPVQIGRPRGELVVIEMPGPLPDQMPYSDLEEIVAAAGVLLRDVEDISYGFSTWGERPSQQRWSWVVVAEMKSAQGRQRAYAEMKRDPRDEGLTMTEVLEERPDDYPCLHCGDPRIPGGGYCESCQRSILERLDPDAGYLQPSGEVDLNDVSTRGGNRWWERRRWHD